MVAVAVDEVTYLLHVGPDVRLYQPRDVGVGDSLHPSQQGHARDHSLDVPGEVTEVGLIEVVHIKDEHPVAGHVGAKVLRMQVALNPDTAGALIRPTILL